MRIPKTISVSNPEYGEQSINCLVDMEKVFEYLGNLLRKTLNFNAFSEMKITLRTSDIPKALIEIASPIHIQEHLYLVCKFSTIDPTTKSQAIYIKWMYQSYDHIRYQSDKYQDVAQVISINKLLLGK